MLSEERKTNLKYLCEGVSRGDNTKVEVDARDVLGLLEELDEMEKMISFACRHWGDDIVESRREARKMREALREQLFFYYWKAEGMKVTQARIHADADIDRISTL